MNQTEIKVRQQEMLNKSIIRLDDLLEHTQKVKIDSPLDKWIIHHCLLNEIPLLKELLTLCECNKTEQIINKVRKVAENLAPVSDLECFK